MILAPDKGWNHDCTIMNNQQTQLPKKTGLAVGVMHSHPLRRTCFGQYQASSAALGSVGDRTSSRQRIVGVARSSNRSPSEPMDSIPKASLDQMLATIPSQQSLDMMVSDNHLSKIAKALINWKSVCTNLGISEAEEEAIKEENSKTDARRYVRLFAAVLLVSDQ